MGVNVDDDQSFHENKAINDLVLPSLLLVLCFSSPSSHVISLGFLLIIFSKFVLQSITITSQGSEQ